MVRYSFEPKNPQSVAMARGSYLRCHFKHCREIAHHIKDMKLSKSKKFLEDVLLYKQAVPFTRFTGGVGRHSQAKLTKAPGDKVRWPQKASKVVLDMLTNLESNADMKGLDTDKLYIIHAQVNRAPHGRRRTYRAHGRINAYMSHPAHIEMMVAEKDQQVDKAQELDAVEGGKKSKLTKKQIAKRAFVAKKGGVEV